LPGGTFWMLREGDVVTARLLARWVGFLFVGILPVGAFAQGGLLSGRVIDTRGKPVAGASLRVVEKQQGKTHDAVSDAEGYFAIAVDAQGTGVLEVHAAKFQPLSKAIQLAAGESQFEIELLPAVAYNESVAVTADVNDLDVLSPDPAEKVFVRQDLLDANPGRPGAPVLIPGYPIETASSGIKAPQYFAPGVAGDHGEPIAQFIVVGSYLVPNNLSANAHGNGYADPNIFIPEILDSVQVDGGAFNVREGNHALNLAATYALRSRLDSFVTVTGDYRDMDVVAGMSPTPRSFVAMEASFGNGFLKRLEHRQQYKFNGQRIYQWGNHELTVFGIGYYGVSYVPGLVPIFSAVAGFPNVGDTIDPRQHDQTHTALVAANDVWRLDGNQQIQISGFFRTYNLTLFSDFGDGLIRQSEFRTVAGQSTDYTDRFAKEFSLLTGLDYEREAPRRDNLDHYDFYVPGTFAYGPFTKVDSNDVTISSVTPYAAGAGELSRYFRYYAGWRRDQIDIENDDLINEGNSFQKWVGVNSPKATVSFLPKESWYVPQVSASFGQAFFTEDPRIGTGSTVGTPVATAHSYQLVLSKAIEKTDVKVMLGHVTTSEELAKIDPDTGLQEDQGPGRLRFLTTTVRRNFSEGSLLVTFSKADARDLDSGDPTPEAPRTMIDVLGNVQKLPLGLQARGEFEFVGRKTLGTGCEPDPNAQCLGVAVKEFRAAVVRAFLEGRLAVGVNMLIAGGYTGQTLENFEPSVAETVVGVRIPTYASANVTYKFGR
jgi:hypothetical protein